MQKRPFKIIYKGTSKIQLAKDEERKCYFYQLTDQLSNDEPIEHHVIAVGLTVSMTASLEKTKKVLKNILKEIAKSAGQYVSIVLFGGHDSISWICTSMEGQTQVYRKERLYKKIEEELVPKDECILSEALESIKLKIMQMTPLKNMRHHIYLMMDEESISKGWEVWDEEMRCYELGDYFHLQDISLDGIGVGHLYNRSMLIKMLGIGGGKLFHIDEMKQSEKYLSLLINDRNKRSVHKFHLKNKKAFLVTSYQFLIGNGEEVETDNLKPVNLLVVYDEPLDTVGYKKRAFIKEADDAIKREFLYHLVTYEFRGGHLDKSLFILRMLADRMGYEVVRNSYSMVEQGRALNYLYHLAEIPQEKSKGKIVTQCFVPDEEPLCLLEVLKMMMDDEKTQLLWDYGMNYEYSGIKRKLVTSQYEFIKPKEGYGKVDKLLIGGKKLNIGLRVKIRGQVENMDTHLKLDAFLYREYNLVVNGNLKINTLYCILSKSLKAKFRKNKLIRQCFIYGVQEICVIDIKKLKIVNERVIKALSQRQVSKTLYDIECIKMRERAIEELIKKLKQGEHESAVKYPLEDLTQMEWRERFNINERGIFMPSEIEEDKEMPVKIYRGTILEWKIEKSIKDTTEEKIVSHYKLYTYGNEDMIRLEAELKLLKYERYIKEMGVQFVRLAYGIGNIDFDDWDEEKTVQKKDTDAKLGINKIIGGKKKLEKKKIGNIIFKQEKYETLIKCSLSV